MSRMNKILDGSLNDIKASIHGNNLRIKTDILPLNTNKVSKHYKNKSN